MNPKKQNRLVRKYPSLYRDVGGDPRTTCMTWGFECGDGWYDIIDNLSAIITHHEETLEKFKVKPTFRSRFNDMLVFIRIKMNKIFYPNYYKQERICAVQVKEKFGSLRAYMSHQDDYISGAIAMAEAMSALTCEVCGKRGYINNDGNWMQCLCKECRMEKDERNKIRLQEFLSKDNKKTHKDVYTFLHAFKED